MYNELGIYSYHLGLCFLGFVLTNGFVFVADVILCCFDGPKNLEGSASYSCNGADIWHPKINYKFKEGAATAAAANVDPVGFFVQPASN